MRPWGQSPRPSPSSKLKSSVAEQDAFKKSLEVALRRLKTRERFSGELSNWLLGKGFEEPVVEATLVHLTKRGLLNDERAADSVVKRHMGRRAVGNEKLRAEMLSLGASEETVSNRLANMHDETEAAFQALSSKKQWAGPAQAGRFLAGRGFTNGAIEGALARVFDDAFSND